MRIGLTISAIGHVVLLGWGLLHLSGAEPFDVTPIDALPVDLVPISDVTKLAEGSKTAPKGDTASQGKVANPTPRPESKRAGAAANDQQTPLTEKAADTAAAKEAEPPPPPPKTAEKPPAPEKPAEKPAAPEKTPDKPAEAPPKSDTGELAAKPDKPADDQPKPAPPAPALPPSKPKPPPTETAEAKTEAPRKDGKPTQPKPDAPKDSKSDDFDPNELAALLNKVDPSGGGGKASDREASLGSENATGPQADMTQSELDALTAAVTACFNPPVGAAGIEQMVVPIRVEFTIDGDLAGPPMVKAIPGGPAGQAVADAAVRAVQRCAPYPFLPRDKYATWQVVNMNFIPPPSY